MKVIDEILSVVVSTPEKTLYATHGRYIFFFLFWLITTKEFRNHVWEAACDDVLGRIRREGVGLKA